MPERGSAGATITTALCLSSMLLGRNAWANSMGGLAFVVLIWPIGILCALLLLVLGIIAAVKLGRGRRASGFATALLFVSIPIAVAYPAVALALSSAFQANPPSGVFLITVLPVEALAVPCAVMGLLLRRRARVPEVAGGTPPAT